ELLVRERGPLAGDGERRLDDHADIAAAAGTDELQRLGREPRGIDERRIAHGAHGRRVLGGGTSFGGRPSAKDMNVAPLAPSLQSRSFFESRAPGRLYPALSVPSG